jgi:hypothetical protein
MKVTVLVRIEADDDVPTVINSWLSAGPSWGSCSKVSGNPS